MRFLLFVFIFSFVSCGQKPTSTNKVVKKTYGPEVDYLLNIKEVDLLDVALDAPIEISGSKIIFKEAASELDQGKHSSCSIELTPGDSFDYKLDGQLLMVKMSSGEKIRFIRTSGEGSGLMGSWSGQSYKGKQLVMRRMTFLSENRLVMRTHCEA